MSFIPLESLEALEAQRRQKEDQEARDELFEDPDYVRGLRDNSPFSGGKVVSEDELHAAQRDEASEPDPEADLLESLEAIEGGEQPPEEEENIEIQQLGVSGEFMPLFSRFMQEGRLTPDDLSALQDAHITSENFETTIQAIDIDDDKKIALTDSLQHLNNPERIEEAQGELVVEYPDVFQDFQLDSTGPETQWVSDFHAEAFTVISQHYMGGETKTPDERSADLSLAISMAAEDLGGKAQVAINTGNTEAFNKNLQIAQDTNLGDKERFEALAKISEINNHVEGVKGKGKLTEQMKIAGKRKLVEAGRFEEFQKHLADLQAARENENQEQIAQMTEQLHTIAQESGLSNGEATALIGGKIDMITEEVSESTQESA